MELNRSMMSSPFGNLDDAFPEAAGKLIYVWEHELEEDSFKPPSNYYVRDCFGGRMYFKTIKRATAKKLSDIVFGVDKYQVRVEMKANIR